MATRSNVSRAVIVSRCANKISAENLPAENRTA
jgi:hypothetical protein